MQPPIVLAGGPVNVFVAIHRTGAQRYSDTYLTNGQKRRRSIAASMRLRRQDDANFTNRTRFLARRVEEMGRLVSAPQLGVVTTGEEFLAALVEASRRGPIANLVIYGHAAYHHDGQLYWQVGGNPGHPHVANFDDDPD